MQTTDVDEEKTTEPRKGFWARQFQQERTDRQRKFDWIFGVIMPVVCFFFDAGIFSSFCGGDVIFGTFKPFAYLLSFTAIIAMMAWLIWGENLKWLSAFIAGLFLTSGVVALAIGIVLLPFSLMGLVIVIGVLGFTPLFTSIVYLRNGVWAIRAAKPFLVKKVLTYSILLSSLAAGIVPYVINVEIYRSLKLIETGNAKTIRAEGRKLWWVSPLVDARPLHWRYYNLRHNNDGTTETGYDEARAIFDVYRDLTGKDVEVRFPYFD